MVWGTGMVGTVNFDVENTGYQPQADSVFANSEGPYLYRNGYQKQLQKSCRCEGSSPQNIYKELRDRRYSDSDAYKSKKPRRKNVRFADDMGLDLVEVRHFVTSDEDGFKWSCSATVPFDDSASWPEGDTCSTLQLETAFEQPCVQSDFVSRVQENKVCLENCISDQKDRKITGFVRVANIGFTKQVKARYSTNNWVTYEEVQASYVGGPDAATDRFMFVFAVPWFMAKGGRVDFAIEYTCQGNIFWDNNTNKNYTVFC